MKRNWRDNVGEWIWTVVFALALSLAAYALAAAGVWWL